MYLVVRPVWANRNLTPEEIQITNTLYEVFLRVVTERQSLIHQVKALQETRGKQRVATAMGNVIDDLFKRYVHAAITRGDLPQDLRITPRGAKGPDLWLDRIAWDITTAEQSQAHIERDVIGDRLRWDVYFVLGY
ncbi:MAG: hypothetical protein AB1631_11905 [Acidobacteriota bacterium]